MFAATDLPTLPPMEILTFCAVMATALAVILAACFGPFLAVASERLAVTRKRGFYAKAAQQIGQMNSLLGILALASFAAGVAYLSAGEPVLTTSPYILPLGATGGSAALGAILIAVYALFRPRKGSSGPVHIAIGLLAGCTAVFSLFLATGLARRLLHTPPPDGIQLPWHTQLIDFFAIPLDSLFWPILAEAIPLGFAFVGAFATVWLLLMRDRQDFGRDYYAFALPLCAKWALLSTLVALPLGVFAFFQGREIMLPELSHLPSLLLDALSVLLPLISCLLWACVIRSEHPMRRKVSVMLACVLLLAGFAGQILIFNKIIPSP